MKQRSKSLSKSSKADHGQRANGMRLSTHARVLFAACLVFGAAGCESWQRKFVRKPKEASKPPSPIIAFQDYSGAMTPLERYRKHYVMFDYWNQDLLESLQVRTPNPKRYRRASAETVNELKTMQSLLNEEAAGRLGLLVEARMKLDRQAQTSEYNDRAQAGLLISRVESQTREIHRAFFWRDVEEQLKAPQPKTPDAAAAVAEPVSASPDAAVD